MGTRGPVPKDPDKLQRRNARPEVTKLEASAVKPPALPDRKNQHPITVRWWDTWAKSPQASLFIGTDWQRLLMLVPLVGEYAAKPTAVLLTAIAQQETKLGATLDDRARLKLQIVRPEAEDTTKPGPRRDPRKLHAVS